MQNTAIDKTVKQPESSLTQITPIGLPDWFSPGGGQGFLTTIDMLSDEGFMLANRAALTKDARLIDHVNQEIEIVHWLASPYDGIDEDTGEQVQSVRIAIIDPAGKVYVTYAGGVRRSLVLLAGRYGLKPWEPPVRVRVATTPAKVGQMLVLLPVGTVNATVKPAKK